MKEQELANKDEIVMGELFPITISDKRIYIVNKKRKKSRKKSLTVRRLWAYTLNVDI